MHYPPSFSTFEGNGGAKKPEAVTPKASTPAPPALRTDPRPIATDPFPRSVPLAFSTLTVDLAGGTRPDPVALAA